MISGPIRPVSRDRYFHVASHFHVPPPRAGGPRGMNPTVDFEEVRDQVLSRTGGLLDIDAGEIRTARRPGWRLFYLPVRVKFTLAFVIAAAWMVLSIYLSLACLHDLDQLIGQPKANY